jgi:hypothetical protein
VYKGYTIQDVLNEPITRFYAFLKEATKLEAQRQLHNYEVALFSQYKHHDQTELLRQFRERIADDSDEIVNIEQIKADRKKLKQLITKKR